MVDLPEYTVEDFTLRLNMADYVAGFRDLERIRGYCRACERYGMCWACPPYDFDDEEYAAGYEYITLVATKIAAVRTGIAVSANESRDADSEMLRRQRLRLDGRLLELERTCNGRAFFAGTCNLCPPAECTRGAKLPCRHPDLIRPSLEACGFDVGVTVEKLFGMELKWGTKESAPEYYILVSALAHDTLFRMEF